eukprot:gnl/MRDRNA2_/MRDRNA2_31705_c0_seq1.p1 gnl/MRDRNA2_/MRDRNA2_31705_c0~~gnl/MRDRNA2_/MRDRNA2_31705_c0_seq1.p1  ORF type:complete len:359 (+),score=67.04 gnl/MRDRNA2_/MRDRNA2_31705_c0_seq1:92-1168(+)
MGALQSRKTSCCSRMDTACLKTGDDLPCVTTCDSDDPCLSNVEGSALGLYRDGEKLSRQLASGPQNNRCSIFFEENPKPDPALENISEGISKTKASWSQWKSSVSSMVINVQNKLDGIEVPADQSGADLDLKASSGSQAQSKLERDQSLDIDALKWTDAALEMINREPLDFTPIAEGCHEESETDSDESASKESKDGSESDEVQDEKSHEAESEQLKKRMEKVLLHVKVVQGLKTGDVNRSKFAKLHDPQEDYRNYTKFDRWREEFHTMLDEKAQALADAKKKKKLKRQKSSATAFREEASRILRQHTTTTCQIMENTWIRMHTGKSISHTTQEKVMGLQAVMSICMTLKPTLTRRRT